MLKGDVGMSEDLTLRELRNRLNDLIEEGYGDMIVKVESKTISKHDYKTIDEDDDYLAINPSPLNINKKDNLYRGHRLRKLGLW